MMDNNVAKASARQYVTKLCRVRERLPCRGADVARYRIPQRHEVGGWSGEHAERDAAWCAQDTPHLLQRRQPIREELKALLAHHHVEHAVSEGQRVGTALAPLDLQPRR
jgi:hypothetical protein